jgi:uncharacterized protein
MPYREWLTTTDAEDPLWQPIRLGQALERVNVPILLQEGWQDRFVDQMIEQYERLRRRGVDVGLTIGPWTHANSSPRAPESSWKRPLTGWQSTLLEPVAGIGQAQSTSS